MKRAIILAMGLAALPVRADLPRDEWRTARPVVLPAMSARGLVYLPLDEKALAAVESLSEYRVVEDGRTEVPYRMALEEGQTETRAFSARVISLATLEKRQAQVTLDLGSGAPAANRVDLALIGDNFRSRARVEGSHDRSRWWLLQRQWIVYRHESRFEQTQAPIPRNEYRFLRITLERLEGSLPEVKGVRVLGVLTIPRRLVAVPAKLSRSEQVRRRATALYLDMGRLNRDLAEVKFEVEEPAFDRAVTIEVPSPARTTPGKTNYEWAGGGRLQRLAAGKAVVLPLQMAAARRLRISIYNGDDRPLTIRRVTLWRMRRGLVFSAEPAHEYALWYGRRNAPQPVYDIQRLPMTTAPAKLPLAGLGLQHKLPVKPPPPPPWSEQHRALFWVVLAGVLVLLAVVIVRAMRGVKGLPPGAGGPP
jgi:hypothetical protein